MFGLNNYMKITDKLEKCGGIYVLTNTVNGKIYVGETLNIKARLPRYLREKGQIIAKAIDKYGVDKFDLYVEYLPDFNKDSLLVLEEELIIKFDCLVPKGYNVCKKGLDGTGRTHSQETKDKIGKAHKGKMVSDETRLKLSNSLKGKTQSKELIFNRTNGQNKPVLQINKDTNEIVKEWDSIKTATQELCNGKDRSGDISRAIKGIKMKTAFGFKWKFKE
jgi:group I intron endonuclease